MAIGVARRAWGTLKRGHVVPAAIGAALTMGGAAPAPAQEISNAPGARALEEIVVTARKRREGLQDTPISVTAFTGDSLERPGLDSTRDLGAYTPNLISSNGSGVSGNTSAGSFFVRGIGQLDFTLNTDPGVGLYVDDVYVARAVGSVMELLDLEAVEVLRGPQGTLFGRNTIGGAIHLRSQPPTQQTGGTAQLEVGTDALRRGGFAASVPLSDTLLTRWSASYTRRDGFIERHSDGVDLGDTDALAGRVAMRWLATEAVTADLVLDGARHREESPPTRAAALSGTSDFGSFYNAVLARDLDCLPPPGSMTNPACFNSQFLTGDPYTTNATFRSKSELDAWGAALTVAVDVSDTMAVKSITAYRDTEALGHRDGDNSPHVIAQTRDTWDHRQFSQELQLTGAAAHDTVNWIVGLYYFEEEGTNLNFVDFAPVFIQSGGSVDNDSTAVFGQMTWNITEAWSLTGGLRYTDETKRFSPDQFVIEDRGTGLPPGFPLVPPDQVDATASEVSPHVNIGYRWSENVMTYATYSEGFKSGGFTQRVFPPLPMTPSFRPEFVEAYEVGVKSGGFGGRLRLNAAAFFTDYTDLQVLALVGVAPTTQNAAEAEIQGFEVELTALPMQGLLVSIGVGYVDAEYTSIGPQVIGLTRDSEFAQIPEWTANGSASYDFHMSGGWSLTPRLDWSYQSGAFMDAINTPEIRQPGYDVFNASLTWRSADERWQVRLAGTNLTDEEYFTAGFADLPVSGIAEVVMARPREWALQFQFDY
jgi:iron complex outermembrane receptor protein